MITFFVRFVAWLLLIACLYEGHPWGAFFSALFTHFYFLRNGEKA